MSGLPPVAQRGPGLASRQRLRAICGVAALLGRSTRAGTRVPATGHLVDERDRRLHRSTRAGTRVPATGGRRGGGATRESSTLNEGRDSRPGNGRPSSPPPRRWRSLNEGRDSRPGNGPPVARHQGERGERSTRAGTRVPATARTPATCSTSSRRTLNEGRDSRPGNGPVRPAVRLPDVAPRSTRAGTRVPATVARSRSRAFDNAAAQRGPGLASRQRVKNSLWGIPRGAHAQRGPGLASRQRAFARAPTASLPDCRSTRAGTRVPATGGPRGERRGRAQRSTRAGTRVPATGVLLGGASVKLRAQRGPGLASRQRTSARPTGGGSAALNEGRDSRPGNGNAT